MEKLKQAIGLLRSVDLTMDMIPVAGVDNQDRFVGCAHAARTAMNLVSDYIADQVSKDKEPEKEEANG